MVRMDTEKLNQRGMGRLPDHMGIVVREVGVGRLIAELVILPHHMAPNGYLHAGTIISLADTAAGYGCLSNLPGGATGLTTIELKTNFLGTAREGSLECSARQEHAGRNTQVWSCTVVHRESGKTIALYRCTQLILYPQYEG